MSGQMWFGTRGYETWVPAPAAEADFSKKGRNVKKLYLDGRAGISRSSSAHAEYNMVWSPTTRDKLRPVTDFWEGIYGDGPVFFIDPMAARYNVLPQYWATPATAAKDAPPLFPGQRPTLTNTPANTLRYPASTATYVTGAASRSLYIPIPPGHVAWVGVHGSATGGAAIRVTPVGGAATKIIPLSVTNSTRVNASFIGSGIDIDVTPVVGTITLSGLIAQILPMGVEPLPGGFISGQGHSGCDFDGDPQVTAYSAVIEGAEVGMTARLIEVG